MVQVVKLAHAGEPAFQHLHIGLRRHRLRLVGRHNKREAVHGVAPAPEAVRLATPLFRPARHGALERMAVQVGHPGQKHRVALVARLRRGPFLDPADPRP